MMFRAMYDEIKRIFVGAVSDEDLAILLKTSVEEQVQFVTDLIKEAPQTPYLTNFGVGEAKCYVLIMHLAMKLLAPDSPELYAFKEQLGIKVVTQWPRLNPPINQFDLFNDKRTPSWVEEIAAASSAAQLLSFNSVHNYEDTVVAIKTALNVGGMEDLSDSRAISKTDPTLGLFVGLIQYQIGALRPDWTVGGVLAAELPESADPRPAYVLAAERAIAEEERRAKIKRKSEGDRRKKLQDDYAARREAVFDAIKNVDISEYVKSCAALDFEAFKKYTDDEDGKPTWVPSELLEPVAAQIQEDTGQDKEKMKRIIDEKFNFVKQFILLKIKEIHPLWFRDLTNGDIALRRSVESTDRFSRQEKAIYGQLNKLFVKYGAEPLAKCVLDVFGITKTSEQIFGQLPKESAVVLNEVVETKTE